MSIIKLQKRLLGGGNRIEWSAQDWERLAKHFNYDGAIPPLLTKRISPVQTSLGLSEVERTTAGSTEVYKFTISDGGTDLSLDQIGVAGWDLSVILANPLVQYGHNGDILPIGRAIWTGIEGGRLKSKMVFGSDDFAQRVKRGVDERIIRGASVGFIPGKWEFSNDKTRQGGINFISGHRLLEWSIVNVPCNSRCLFESVQGVKDAAALTEQAQVLPAAMSFNDEAKRRIAERRRVLASQREHIHASSTSRADQALQNAKARAARIEQLRRVNKHD
jgi:hypothetical protein